MVREYNKNDIDAIIRLFDVHNELSDFEQKEKRKELEDGAKVLVYEDNDDIKGICSYSYYKNSQIGNCASIIMSINENYKFKEVADSLWKSVQTLLKEKGVVYISTFYNEKYNQWNDFYSEKQFEKWFVTHDMIYKGDKCKETKLTFRNYEDKDFDIYYANLCDCFYQLRKENDIKPYNIYTGLSSERYEKVKKEMEELKDYIYLFYDGEKFVGSSMIKDGEIDDLYVVPELQGNSYGRKIMEASLNLAIQRNFDKITLGVVDWNKLAINLYKNLGFEIYQSLEYRRLILTNRHESR